MGLYRFLGFGDFGVLGLPDLGTKTAGILQVSGLRIWGFEMGLLQRCPEAIRNFGCSRRSR